MNFKLIKEGVELINFVNKYKNEFEYMYDIQFETNDRYRIVNKESILEYIGFMYRNLNLERFFKNYLLVVSEEESKNIKYGTFYVEVEEFYASPNSDYQKKRYDSYIDSPSFLENNKFNDFLYEILSNIISLTRNKKYLPDGIILDKYNVDEEVLKKFLGLKFINIGTEFEFLDDQGMRRLYVCKLLDYKKEIRKYFYRVLLCLNRNNEDFNKLNIYDQNYIKYGFNSMDYSNLLDFFFIFFDTCYNYYLNNINNLETLSNLFDYEKNKDKILSYIQDYSKQLVSEDLKKQLDISDIKNFNKEYAHYLYLRDHSGILDSKHLIDTYIFEAFDMWYPVLEDHNKTMFEDLFLRNKREYFIDYIKGNIWGKGYGKYLDLK